jgi:hypothetical protein
MRGPLDVRTMLAQTRHGDAALRDAATARILHVAQNHPQQLLRVPGIVAVFQDELACYPHGHHLWVIMRVLYHLTQNSASDYVFRVLVHDPVVLANTVACLAYPGAAGVGASNALHAWIAAGVLEDPVKALLPSLATLLTDHVASRDAADFITQLLGEFCQQGHAVAIAQQPACMEFIAEQLHQLGDVLPWQVAVHVAQTDCGRTALISQGEALAALLRGALSNNDAVVTCAVTALCAVLDAPSGGARPLLVFLTERPRADLRVAQALLRRTRLGPDATGALQRLLCALWDAWHFLMRLQPCNHNRSCMRASDMAWHATARWLVLLAEVALRTYACNTPCGR